MILPELYSSPTPSPMLFRSAVVVEPGTMSPMIQFDQTKGTLLVKGNAMDDSAAFSLDSMVRIAEKYLALNNKISCYIFLQSFNTKAGKSLFNLFRVLKRFHIQGKKIKVHWFSDYENESMLESGLDFADLFQLNFDIQPT